ncbi:hypothetical protein ACLB2K_002248 [Fragaria x ananassa]
MSCLVVFAVGEKYSAGNGFHVIAAHTDSPCLKLKPRSASTKSGCLMINVLTYGGGLWHTCTVNKDGFKPNAETHLIPLLASKLEETASSDTKEKSATISTKGAHHPLLMQALSDEINCNVDDIVSIELNVCDTQPSCLGRLDNLASSYRALRALIDSCKSPGDLASEHAIPMVALFDNEEIRTSAPPYGADFPQFATVRRRQGRVSTPADSSSFPDLFPSPASPPNSSFPVRLTLFEVLGDLAGKLEFGGLAGVGKRSGKRLESARVEARPRRWRKEGHPHLITKRQNPQPSNSGICGEERYGMWVRASGAGIRTVDCGIAQLSMHSVREICGKEDIDIAHKYFKAFYQTFSSIYRKLIVDL